MPIITEDDLIQSIADAFQFISYFHPPDFIRAMSAAWEKEENPSAKQAMSQILVNSRMCAIGRRPICQDTGSANIHIKYGMQAQTNFKRSLQEICDEGTRQGYLRDENPLRASVVVDPFDSRKNSGDNTPCMLTVEMVAGDTIEVEVAAKGGGSENKSKFTTLNPSGSVADWVVQSVESMGAGWCPPGILGIGIGGNADKAMALAKQALSEPLDMADLIRRGPSNRTEELRVEIAERVNALGIGAQGLGGITTVLDVKIKSFPTHAASLPVGMIPNCAATRHAHFTLDGSGAAEFIPPDLKDWPEILLDQASAHAIKVDVDNLTDEVLQSFEPGQTLLLSGTIYTGRDAAHKRMIDMLDRGEELDGITAHLREDRRHIRDEDIAAIRKAIDVPLNFEMAATSEMVAIALKTKPNAACIVPERRTEVTTEGGLSVVGQEDRLADMLAPGPGSIAARSSEMQPLMTD